MTRNHLSEPQFGLTACRVTFGLAAAAACTTCDRDCSERLSVPREALET